MSLRSGALVPGLTGLLVVLSAVACGAAAPSPTEIPAGSWAGEGARASVSAEGASFELDCAGAAIAPPLTLDAEGRFELSGWWERRAGPQPYRRNDARFRGRVRGRVLTVAIDLTASAEQLGAYELTLGGEGRAPAVCR